MTDLYAKMFITELKTGRETTPKLYLPKYSKMFNILQYMIS